MWTHSVPSLWLQFYFIVRVCEFLPIIRLQQWNRDTLDQNVYGTLLPQGRTLRLPEPHDWDTVPVTGDVWSKPTLHIFNVTSGCEYLVDITTLSRNLPYPTQVSIPWVLWGDFREIPRVGRWTFRRFRGTGVQPPTLVSFRHHNDREPRLYSRPILPWPWTNSVIPSSGFREVI